MIPGESALWAEVDLGRVRRNVANLKRLLAPGCRLLAVVKANGYGHGDAQVAAAAIDAGAGWLAVARVQEAKSLREAGIDAPVLLLAEPHQSAVSEAVKLGLTPTIYTSTTAKAFAEAAAHAAKLVKAHIKIDTGMHRYGVQPEDAISFFDEVASLPGIEVEGVWSHFAVAEDVLNPFTKQQFTKFMDVLDDLGSRTDGLIKHMANSAATMTFPEAHLDMVRAGIAVYGIHPSVDLEDRGGFGGSSSPPRRVAAYARSCDPPEIRVELEPAMAFKSRVGMVKRLPAGEAVSYGQRYTLERDANVATIPCGYADGLSRALTNQGEALIRGRRYVISGTITMDHFLVDVGDDEVERGDEVVILGEQGAEKITAHEIARRLGTIPYEVVCGIGTRVPRVYLEP
jgi:alanine racemase